MEFAEARLARRFMVKNPCVILYDSQHKRWQWDSVHALWLCADAHNKDFRVARWQPEDWNAPFYDESIGERLAVETVKKINEMVKKSFTEMEQPHDH